jgi:putative transposase
LYQGTPSGVPQMATKAALAAVFAADTCNVTAVTATFTLRSQSSNISPGDRSLSIPHRNSDPRHVILDDRTFFVTASIWGKRSLLQSERAARLFLANLFDYRDQQKYRVHEFVVMPDHFHVLTTVGAGITIERAVQFVKGGFAFRATRELGFQAPVWQKGFSEIRVLDAEAFEVQSRYIWQNPVRAHLVALAESYAYSSAGTRVGLDPPPQRLKPPFLKTA